MPLKIVSKGKRQVKLNGNEYLVVVEVQCTETDEDISMDELKIISITPNVSATEFSRIKEYIENTAYFDVFEWDNSRLRIQ